MIDRRARFGAARVARLATVDVEGHPRVVPCCFALDGDVLFTAVDGVKRKSTLDLARLADVRANASVTLVVDHYDDDWAALWWVRVRGIAREVDDDRERAHALALLAEKYEQYATHPPPGAVIAVTITEWRAWSAS